jgi:hypothetical protein
MASACRIALFFACFLSSGGAYALGGLCPAGVPVTGNNCYFISASGLDTNDGMSEKTPWLHAPGMPSCASKCAAYSEANGAAAGNGLIFRGGDTWHFGNTSASPYTGGTWVFNNSGGGAGPFPPGTPASCDMTDSPSPVMTSCIYIGVDKAWWNSSVCGSSWCRPIMSGDNPASTSAVSSCPYQSGTSNVFFQLADLYVVVDNFEWTGACYSYVATCSENGTCDGQGYGEYIQATGAPWIGLSLNRYSNNYFHNFTHLPWTCTANGGVCNGITAITGEGAQTYGPGNVCDGWDSDPGGVICLFGGPSYIVYDNVFANEYQIVVNGLHDWHDNQWFGYTYTGDGIAHGNLFESNVDAPNADEDGNPEPSTPFNVFYNNILGHNSTGTDGDVKFWACPNDVAAEYYFGNIEYDQGSGNYFDIVTGSQCPGDTLGTAGQYLFNNTFDFPSDPEPGIGCPPHAVAQNNHVITDVDATNFFGPCGSNNLVMTHAAAVAQGYMAAGTGTSGQNGNTTCANDTTPCSPTSAGNSTVGAGVNLQSYCTTLLSSSAPEIVRAGNACQYGTTDACTYDTTTHSVSCPRATLMARPASAPWDVGAYQWPVSAVDGGVSASDAGRIDAGSDAGYRLDAGSLADAGVRIDGGRQPGGEDGGAGGLNGGCGCSTGAVGVCVPLALALLIPGWRRRRR